MHKSTIHIAKDAKEEDDGMSLMHTVSRKHLRVKNKDRSNTSARSGISKKGLSEALREGLFAKLIPKRRNSNASFISAKLPVKPKSRAIRKEKQDARLKLDFDDSVSMLCKLCNKETPIRFYRNEEAIKNIPI